MPDRLRDLGVDRLALIFSLFAVVIATVGNITAVRTKSQVIHRQCLAIEELKRFNRIEARAEFTTLEERYRLVRVPLTPGRVVLANETLERKLRSNQASEC